MKVIGLTGGIASGKSTVASILAEFGATIIDADKVARDVVEPGQPAWRDIRKAFGEDALLADGSLNRQWLGNLIFNDPTKRQMLNSIIHPRIIEECQKILEHYKQAGEKAVILEVPLLIETGMDTMVDEVWLVAVEVETQISRLIKRDGLSRGQALKRIESQMSLEEKIPKADIIIDGQLTINKLRSYLKTLWNNILAIGVEVKEKD
ncbi:dephospho-CoA kinase [Desulfitibacter alkalitolerans]|uniref:dephospho-CoA kinase n=1 Tax=Desulfitibacter alkalitolerans TaxID=264641 RepID=UPI00047FA4D9|nr:dephospho-CoA kinase [Desulfitibacter alkalitolerans]